MSSGRGSSALGCRGGLHERGEHDSVHEVPFADVAEVHDELDTNNLTRGQTSAKVRAASMKKFVPGIGESDFRLLRESGYDFVDKTFFIRDVLADSSKVLLFPRPRRFGKTTNLSMLGHFLRKTDENLAHLFKDFVIANDANAMAHFQRYPVITVTFKDVKAKTWAAMLNAIVARVAHLFVENRHLLDF